MRKTILVLTLFVVSLGVVAQTGTDPVPQGAFAVMVAEHLNTEAPNGGWTVPEAVRFLSDLGVAPTSGWQADTSLNQAEMVHTLRTLGLDVYTSHPEQIVSYSQARAIFFTYDNFFKNWDLKTKTIQQNTTTHVDTGVGGTAGLAPEPPTVPTSPATP